MSSSISSSDVRAIPQPAVARVASVTLRVAAVVAVLLLGVEALTRLKLMHMSKEYEQFRGYPARAAELAHRSGTRVAVVGASITHEDIDYPALDARLERLSGRTAHSDLFSADHSYINTWQYMLERYVWRPKNHVDLVVLPFIGNALYDGNEIEIGRLAWFFTDVHDWPQVLRTDLRDNSDRGDFIASSFWASWAARDRMRELVFTTIFPDYKGFAREQQAVLVGHVAPGRGPRRPKTLHALDRLLASAKAADTRLVFVATPTRHTEWNDAYDAIRRRIADAGMDYVDLRTSAQVADSSYVDLVHMNETGRAFFTERLADVLAPLVAPGAEHVATVAGAPAS